jgi:hypothetical protein
VGLLVPLVGRSQTTLRAVSTFDPDTFVGDLLSAPRGVALLAHLEARQVAHMAAESVDPGRFMGRLLEPAPRQVDPQAVHRVLNEIAEQPLSWLLQAALEAGHDITGPNNPVSPNELYWAYRLADRRAEIARAIVSRFGPELARPLDLSHQEWWNDESPSEPGRVVATMTAPFPEIHDQLFAFSDEGIDRLSRWELPVRDGARVFEINRPADWLTLVERYPQMIEGGDSFAWHLPGHPQSEYPQDELRRLEEISHGHAARTHASPVYLLDNVAAASDYDGIHLTWAGVLTTEAFISDVPGGGVTMLVLWERERTCWFNDVFGDPVALLPPNLGGRIGFRPAGVDLAGEPERRNCDMEELAALRDGLVNLARFQL